MKPARCSSERTGKHKLLVISCPQQKSALWIHFQKCDARTPINSTCEVNQGGEAALCFSSSLNKRHEHLPFRMIRKQTSRCKQVQAQLSTDLKNYSSCLIVTNCWSVNCGAGQAGHWLLLLNYSTTIHAIHVTHRQALLTENWKWHVWTPTESLLFIRYWVLALLVYITSNFGYWTFKSREALANVLFSRSLKSNSSDFLEKVTNPWP